jgi:single-stranded-DNA-specific exonuclease
MSYQNIKTVLGNILSTERATELYCVEDFTSSFLSKRWLHINPDDAFFTPKLTDLHDPFLFPQMDRAVDRILIAREQNERVVIFGDYDVDGVSSTAMLMRFFAMIGIQVSYRIPHRSQDGYGMKSYFFDDLAHKNVKLVISVDCGTRDIATIQYAKELGIDVIVTDHHAVPEVIPKEAIAIITPKLPGTTYPFSWLSGSGTAFKLLSAVASRIYSWTEYERIVLSYSDFAALWTVADMVPLLGENRTIVQFWLSQLVASRSPGLRKMIEWKDTGSADCIGFQIWPRINAAWRMDHADIALQALTCSEARVEELLQKLEDLNLDRRKSTQDHFARAETSIDLNASVLIHAAEDIEHGVIWLVAWRLCEKYKKPSIVCKIENDLVFWSARSQEGYNITDALTRVSWHLKAFGWHWQAAGFSMSISWFKEFVIDICNDASFWMKCEDIVLHESALYTIPSTTYTIDYILSIDNVSFDLIDEIEKFWPFGMKYQKPIFLIQTRNCPKIELLWSSGEHLKFVLPNAPHIKMQGFWIAQSLDTIKNIEEGFWFICELQRETWKGRVSISIMVKDIVSFKCL